MVSDIHDILYSKLSGEQLTPEEERLFEVWYSKPSMMNYKNFKPLFGPTIPDKI